MLWSLYLFRQKIMANYTKKPNSVVEFTLTVTEPELAKAQTNIIKEYKKNLSIKGFRKGHAPNDMVIAHFGVDNLLNQGFNDVIEREYRKFVKAESLSPVAAPNVDFGDMKELPVTVTVTVEVFPEIDLGEYKKIKVAPLKVEVTDKEVEDALATVMADMSLGTEVKRAAKDQDQVVVNFAGKDEKGNVLPKTEGKDVPFRIGFGHFLSDLEKAFVGMKAGEEKTAVPVKFPKNYHAKDMAGKTVHFDIKLVSVKEVSVKNLNEDLVEKITGKKQSVEDLKKQMSELIEANKKRSALGTKKEEYKAELGKKVKIELPQSWINKEVESRLAYVKRSPEFVANADKFWEQLGKTEEELVKEFQKEADVSLKAYLALSEIVKAEKIELTDAEYEGAHMKVHQRLKTAGHDSPEHAQLMAQEVMNAKIDKFFSQIFDL
ncbi:trigger factor [bacterium DOLZORAL124_38_8]|nr:MAG: trigger factor [bacterium DOLZORAL124_38_8]